MSKIKDSKIKKIIDFLENIEEENWYYGATRNQLVVRIIRFIKKL